MDKREAVKGLYPKSKRWGARVNKMSDAQVFAIYTKRQNQRKTIKKEGEK